jgi:transposase
MVDNPQPGLFDSVPDVLAPVEPREEPAPSVARVRWPNRMQLELRPSDLDSLLPEGHRARVVWAWVEQADLSRMYAGIRAVEGGSGRTAIAPEILYALWLYATLDGVGTARTLARLAQAHDAYRWICGGVQVNYHTLSDFRSAHGEALDALLTDSVAALMAVGAVTLERVAQDGMRIRASAGAASFRRAETLEQCLEEARAQVAALKQQVEEDPGARTRRQQAARERAARERQERIEQALARLPELAEIKAKQGKSRAQARASTTDAEATVMKMGDGGFRPAYNGQFATDTASQVVVGVAAVSVGSDMAQLLPMIEQIEARCGQSPEDWLVDGGYPAHEQLDGAAAHTVVYAPVPKPKDPATDPHVAKDGDSEAVGAWRERMGTEEAKAIYKDRAATAECVNAQARERGLTRLRVRGAAKVRCVLLLHALAHNLMRTLALAPDLLAYGEGAPSGTAVTA